MIKHVTTPENAEKFADWIANRGGVAFWQSLDLSDPGFSMSSPALTKDGQPYPQPHWKVGTIPAAVYTDPQEIGVIQYKEYARFHVAVRRSSSGLSYKLTDASSARLRKKLHQAEETIQGDLSTWVTYVFDYPTQEAVVLVPESVIPLPEYMGTKILDF